MFLLGYADLVSNVVDLFDDDRLLDRDDLDLEHEAFGLGADAAHVAFVGEELAGQHLLRVVAQSFGRDHQRLRDLGCTPAASCRRGHVDARVVDVDAMAVVVVAMVFEV